MATTTSFRLFLINTISAVSMATSYVWGGGLVGHGIWIGIDAHRSRPDSDPDFCLGERWGVVDSVALGSIKE